MTSFYTAVKDINLQKSEKMPVQSLFFEFKICIPQDAMCCENFGRFHHRKYKKITNICLGIYNSRLKPIILTEIIVQHYLIIAHYMW